MSSQEPVTPRQIKPDSRREPETSSPFQQRNVNLHPPRKSVEGYKVVAERLGFKHDEALSLGRALAGLNAQSKGQRLGIFKPTPKGTQEGPRT